MTDYCSLCGKAKPTPLKCKRCGDYFCKDCYDKDEELCLKCVQEQ